MLKIVAFLCILLLKDLNKIICRPNKVYEDFYFYAEQNNTNITYMMMPEDNGIVVSAILGGISSKQRTVNETIDFLLWTRKTAGNPEWMTYNINTRDGFHFNNLNLSSQTIFLIHGFTDQYLESDFFNVMRKVLLLHDNYNVIGVDWSRLSRIPWNLKPADPPYIHVITYNLGALVARVAGILLERKIERITGLDPPHILINELPAGRKLSKDAAELVEIIHSSGDYLGTNEPMGHRDFYPNGGKWPQPGCSYDIADRCSPRLSYVFYAEAILGKNNYMTTRCTDYKAYQKNRCLREPTVRLFNDAPPRLASAENTTTSRSFIQGAKTVLSSAANAVQKGVEKVPGLGNLVFGSCVEAPVICPNKNITFWFYSKSHPVNGVQISESEESLFNLPRNSSNPWKVIIHGYTKSKEEIPNPELRSAYFRRGDYNIISVDYSPLAQSKCYVQSVNNVPLIAKCTARFLDRLMDEGFFKSDNLHIIGFSLGAQIAGLIHDYLKHEKPFRVTGLDPASPLFDGVVHHKLTEEAGQFVDVIHTNALVKGQIVPSGHVDFYVNGGSSQPGCLMNRNESFSTCNHDRSPMYFAESINSQEGFWGIPCGNYAKFLTGACNTEEPNLVLMGEDIPHTAKGLYFLQTTNKAPFALGKRVTAKLL